MMSPNKIKAVAIAKLKNGELPENIGVELEISPTIVMEWAEELSPSEMVAKEVNAIALQKAQELLKAEQTTNTKQLQGILLNLAIAITDEVKMGLYDHEIAKAVNISADTVSKLQNAFFAKGTQIAVINNNSNQASEELKIFKGTLRN